VPVQGKCITLRLTDAQKEAVRAVTGKAIDAVTLEVDELEGRAAKADPEAVPEADAIVWECLNPYP
jgi:hypothetical protein